MGSLISYVPSVQKSTCFLRAISVLSTMIMRDVLATLVMSAGEPFPVLALYFKSLATQEKRKGPSHERNGYFEVWTSYGPAGHRWLPRNGVGNTGSLWCLVSQGHHRSPGFL